MQPEAREDRPLRRFPLAMFVVLLAFFSGRPCPRSARSALATDRQTGPGVQLAQLHAPTESLSTPTLKGKVWLLNVWASWCVSCRVEHPLLVQLRRSEDRSRRRPRLQGQPADARAWLDRSDGNPYTTSIVDLDGRVGIDYGVYGVPETFLIDKEGVIRYRHAGPLSAASLESKILPLVRQLQSERTDE